MYQVVVPKVLEKYGVAYKKILPVQKGYRNESYPIVLATGETANLIFYKREPKIVDRIDSAHKVSEFLADNGLPTRRRIDRRVLQLATKTAASYAALYNYLPGATIPWEGYSQAHIKLVGKTLSDMHATVQKMPIKDVRVDSDEYPALARRMTDYFSISDVSKALKRKLDLSIDDSRLAQIVSVIGKIHNLPNQQVLHMDFVRGNILFDKSGSELVISGILDFEKATVGHPLLDIARTLAFLLVDCKYKSPQQVRKYFLYSGYLKHGKNPLPVIKFAKDGKKYDLLELLVKFFLMHDFYKFLRHNPYESLSENEHFVRTRDILIERNMLNYF